MDELRTREIIAVAGGRGKAGALAAVLRSGVLDGLVTDENAAAELCEGNRDAAQARQRVLFDHGADRRQQR
jgi:DNA-binding transcriptional regulator LsrR (DeoR family)